MASPSKAGCGCQGGGAKGKARRRPAGRAPARRRAPMRGGEGDCSGAELDMGTGMVPLGDAPVGNIMHVATAATSVANPPGLPSTYAHGTHFTPRYDYMQWPASTTASTLLPPFVLPTVATTSSPATGGGVKRRAAAKKKTPGKAAVAGAGKKKAR